MKPALCSSRGVYGLVGAQDGEAGMIRSIRKTETGFSDAARFQLLVEAVTDYAIYMLDPGGTIVSWNAGAQRFKGYTAAEILGQNFERFYEDVDRRSGLPRRALETAAREGKFEAEGWRVRKDGDRFWAHVVIDPIRDGSGQLLGSPRSRATLPSESRPRRSCAAARNASACWWKVSPTTRSTCSIPRGW
jgi:PAS domain S-box-containing protein